MFSIQCVRLNQSCPSCRAAQSSISNEKQEAIVISLFLFVGKEATLFCALYIEDCKKLYDDETIEKILEPTRELLSQKLAQIPNNIKIVIEYTEDFRLWQYKEIPQETLKLKLYRERKLSLATVLELLTKRWMTLDLISVFREVKRTLHIRMAPQLMAVFPDMRNINIVCDVYENLSFLPRLQGTDQ